MKRSIIILCILILLCSLATADLDLPKYKDNYYIPGYLIVKFKEKPILKENKAEKLFEVNINNETLTSKTGKQAFNPRKEKGRHFVEDIYIFEFDKDKDISKIIKKIEKNPNIEWVEPNYLFEDLSIPNDPYYSQQWNFPKTGAPAGWEIETGDEQILIATVDTGIDWKHEDLAEKVWNNPGEDADHDGYTLEWNGSEWVFDPDDLNSLDDDSNGYVDDLIGWDFVGSLVPYTNCAPNEDCNSPDNDPLDIQGHGTFQYGLMGGKTNNNAGIAGMCWNCKLMGLRAGYKKSDGSAAISGYDAAQIAAYAADNGIRGVNFAFSASASYLQDAVSYAHANGVFLSAAAGNSGYEQCSGPSQYSEVMAVGGTDSGDNRWTFPGGGSNYGSCVEVSAPAKDLFTTWVDGYTTASGTSGASPQVTGLAGLILSKNPTLTNEEVRQIIKDSADNITTDHPIGGRINVSRALQMTPSLNPCSGKDFNNDSKVDWLDTGVFSGCYGSNITINPGCERSDFNDDGKVTYLDIGPFSACYGSSW